MTLSARGVYLRIKGLDRFRTTGKGGVGQWGSPTDAHNYCSLETARTAAHTAALEMKADIEIVRIGGWNPYEVLETVEYAGEDSFKNRVAAAVDGAKAELRTLRDKLGTFSWSGGTVPEYYKFFCRGVALTPFDIIEALNLNFNRGCVLKYVMRAGKKESEIADLKKARNCLDREIARLEGAIE
jgi:hypothetical protein